MELNVILPDDIQIKNTNNFKLTVNADDVLLVETDGTAEYYFQLGSEYNEWSAPYFYDVEVSKSSSEYAETVHFPSSKTWTGVNNTLFKAIKFTPSQGTFYITADHKCKVLFQNVADATDVKNVDINIPGNAVTISSLTTNSSYYAAIYEFTDIKDADTSLTFRLMTEANKVPAPEISYDTNSKLLTISCEDPDATIFYTTDLEDPKHEGVTPVGTTSVYENAISVDRNMTVKALAWVDGMDDSRIVSKTISNIKIEAPQLYWSSDIDKFLFTDEEGSSTYYTVDKSDPRSSSTRIQYDGNGFLPPEDCTLLRAYSAKEACDDSEIVQWKPWIDFRTEVPVIEEDRVNNTVNFKAGNGCDVYWRKYVKDTTPGDFEKYDEANGNIPVVGNMYVEAYAAQSGFMDSEVNKSYIDWVKADAPVLDYADNVVTVTSDVPNHVIRYSFDASAAASAFETLGSGNSIDMGGNNVVRVYVSAEGYQQSDIVTFDKTARNLNAPVINYSDGYVSFTSVAEGATVYYKVYADGGKDNVDYAAYGNSPVAVDYNMNVCAYVSKNGWNNSGTVEMIHADRPTISVADLKATITGYESGAAVHYTIDGSKPTLSSPIYDGTPIPLSGDCQIRAVAFKDGKIPGEADPYAFGFFQCEMPTLSSYDGQIVRLSVQAGSKAYYSLNGAPAEEYPAGGVDMQGLGTLTAYCERTDWARSETFTFTAEYYSVASGDGVEVRTSKPGRLAAALDRFCSDGYFEAGELTVVGKLGKEESSGDDFGFIRGNMSVTHLDLTAVDNSADASWKEPGTFAGADLRYVTMPSGLPETVGDNMFAGCRRLGAVILTKNDPAPANLLSGLDNPNVLVYVNSTSYVKSLQGGFTNIVSGVAAEKIILTDGYPFFCPKPFTAQTISFTREFTKKSGYGKYGNGSAGWETIALPFGATTFVHETKGGLTPFADESNAVHKFWLYNNDEGAWNPAKKMTPNRVYLISFPNNEEAYVDDYNISGAITFSATDAEVPATPDEETLAEKYREYGNLNSMLRISYEPMENEKKDGLLMVNYLPLEYNGINYEPGGCFTDFEEGYGIRPFEAYLEAFDDDPVHKIFDNSGVEMLPEGIGFKVWGEGNDLCILSATDRNFKVFDLNGQLVREVSADAGATLRVKGLTKGIYFVGNQKVLLTQ